MEVESKQGFFKTARQFLSGALGLAMFLFFLVVGVRGCTGAAWVSGNEPEQYLLESGDGRVLSIFILPKNKVALLYADSANDEREAALVSWRGTYGDHYGFGLWHMEDAPVPGPNWRIFRRGFEPVFMQMDTLEKFREGRGNPVFPGEGNSVRDFILLAEDRSALVFDDMMLRKTDPSPIFAAFLGAVFRDEEAVAALQRIQSGRLGSP